jgi:hypothetical protein
MTEKIPSESQEQMLFVQWFKRTYPTVKIMSIPNGGHRHIAVAAKMKAEGQAAGAPDIFIPAWLCWIEFKRIKGGVVSPVQKDWIEYLESIGHRVIIGRGFEDAKRQILDVKKPTEYKVGIRWE